MAAPPEKTIGDLSGKWLMNKSLSDSTDPVLTVQGMGWVTRKAIGLASVTCHMKAEWAPAPTNVVEGDEQASGDAYIITMDQVLTGGVRGTQEIRVLDSRRRGHVDHLFGNVVAYSRLRSAGDLKEGEAEQGVDDAFLLAEWITGPDEQKAVKGLEPPPDVVLWSRAASVDKGWVATQVWGFQKIQGERRFVKHVVMRKGAERATCRMVYDWAGEL